MGGGKKNTKGHISALRRYWTAHRYHFPFTPVQAPWPLKSTEKQNPRTTHDNGLVWQVCTDDWPSPKSAFWTIYTLLQGGPLCPAPSYTQRHETPWIHFTRMSMQMRRANLLKQLPAFFDLKCLLAIHQLIFKPIFKKVSNKGFYANYLHMLQSGC